MGEWLTSLISRGPCAAGGDGGYWLGPGIGGAVDDRAGGAVDMGIRAHAGKAAPKRGRRVIRTQRPFLITNAATGQSAHRELPLIVNGLSRMLHVQVHLERF